MAQVLVVCTGNVCRSPIAEGFLRRAFGGLLVEVGERDSGAGLCKGTGGGQAHAGGGAGDEGDLAGEVVGGVHQ